MTDKVELKSCHEVIDTVDVANIESIFYGKPTDPDILTVLMTNGKRLYCDEVCPVDSLQEESIIDDLGDYINELSKQFPEVSFAKLSRIAVRAAKWQKEQIMKDATDVTVHIDAGGYPYIPQMELYDYDYDNDVPLAKEGDKYKVVLIKEE